MSKPKRPLIHARVTLIVSRPLSISSTPTARLFSTRMRTTVLMAGEVVLSAGTVHSPTILMHSGIGPAEQLHGIAVIVDARLKSGSIAESCRGAHMSGGLSHRRPKTIVDQVAPESIRAAAHDIACRASEVYVLAVGTCAIN